MRVVFRADASDALGSGHIMRCLALAHGLRERGARCEFILRPASGDRREAIEGRGFSVRCLDGTDQDASSTLALLGVSDQTDWVVVDHYALDAEWERAVRPFTERLMVIDDLADRDHDCDLLLDQNLVAGMRTRYTGRVPASCGLLLGPDFALLHPDYESLHGRVPPREGPVRRILISFGGGDGVHCMGHAVKAVLALPSEDLQVDIVAPGGFGESPDLRQAVASRGNVHVHDRLPTLAPLMAQADLALGASGGTTWERLCMGLPSIVVTLAENQRPIAEELDRRQLVRWLGDQEEVTAQAITEALDPLLKQGSDEQWSLRCSAVVDGGGVRRVGAAMIAGGTSPLSVRFANLTDEQRILDWANDPQTRANAFAPGEITAATHRTWFRSSLRAIDECALYIVETIDGLALGVVRVQREPEGWEVHFNLGQPFRGRGLGRRLVEVALQEFDRGRPGQTVFGKVKASNAASRRIFEGLGFTFAGESDGVLTYNWRAQARQSGGA